MSKANYPLWLADQIGAAALVVKFIETANETEVAGADRASIEAETRNLARQLYMKFDRSTSLDPREFENTGQLPVWQACCLKFHIAITHWRERRVPAYLRPAYRSARSVVWLLKSAVRDDCQRADFDSAQAGRALRLLTAQIMFSAGWSPDAPPVKRLLFCAPVSNAVQ